MPTMAKNQRTSNPTHGPKRTLCSPRNSAAARNGGHEKLPMDGIGRCATAITLWLPRQPMNGARSSPRTSGQRGRSGDVSLIPPAPLDDARPVAQGDLVLRPALHRPDVASGLLPVSPANSNRYMTLQASRSPVPHIQTASWRRCSGILGRLAIEQNVCGSTGNPKFLSPTPRDVIQIC